VAAPNSLDAVAACLAAADPEGFYEQADVFEEAHRTLQQTVDLLGHHLGQLDGVWQRVGNQMWLRGDSVRLEALDALRSLDDNGHGELVRRAADTLAASKTKVRHLMAQRTADPTGAHDAQARRVLGGLSDVYTEIGVGLGGARSDPQAVLAAADDLVDSGFAPTTKRADPSDPGGSGSPAAPASSGAGGGSPGYGMMPMMPMGMGLGMGMGAGATAGVAGQALANRDRKGGHNHADPDIWSDPDGWTVPGRPERPTLKRQ
jgi:hypothetical protein